MPFKALSRLQLYGVNALKALCVLSLASSTICVSPAGFSERNRILPARIFARLLESYSEVSTREVTVVEVGVQRARFGHSLLSALLGPTLGGRQASLARRARRRYPQFSSFALSGILSLRLCNPTCRPRLLLPVSPPAVLPSLPPASRSSSLSSPRSTPSLPLLPPSLLWVPGSEAP